jgi:hypothetical protein
VALGASAAISLRLEGDRAKAEPVVAERWARVGRWLEQHTPPEATVAAVAIGAIGYHGRRRVVDMLGLVDAHVARGGALHPGAAPGHGRYHTSYVFGRRPDLVVYPRSGFPRTEATLVTRPGNIDQRYAYALYDFVLDPRCAASYEHVLVRLEDGSFLEMQKRRGFSLGVEHWKVPD